MTSSVTFDVKHKSQWQGFTLLELSIVLVIIGLLVGGILGGQDLINAAQIRKGLKQIEQYQSAVGTFQAKYDAMPGDMFYLDAAKFGFATRSGAAGRGNGDGLISGSMGYGRDYPYICGESRLFWNDLSTAGLISGTYSGQDGDTWNGCGGALANRDAVNTVVPPFSLGNKMASVHVYTIQGANYFQILYINAVNNGGQMVSYGDISQYALTPIQAFKMDSKTDDGLPFTGSVVARDVNMGGNGFGMPPFTTPAGAGYNVCVTNATGNPYNINSSTGGNTFACSLQIIFK